MTTSPDAHTAALDQLRASLPDDERRARFDHLIALLDTPETDARVRLIETTVARVAAARDDERTARIGAAPHHRTLSDDEARAVDAWAEGGSDARVERLATLLDLPADPRREARIDGTLAAVQHDVDSQSDRLRLDPAHDELAARRRFRLADLGAVAAVLTIIAAISVPALTNLQTNTWGTQTTANLQRASLASSLFAADHDARVPHAVHRTVATSAPTTQWWRVGDPRQSHSANLFSLIALDYVPAETLNAPGNPDAPDRLDADVALDWASHDQVSYSYRLFDAATPPRLINLDQSILIADRSPVVRQALETGTIDPTRNSDNHRGKGQHVAFGDASVLFLATPTLPNGDNIWLPRRAEQTGRLLLDGSERPAGPGDQFVGP